MEQVDNQKAPETTEVKVAEGQAEQTDSNAASQTQNDTTTDPAKDGAKTGESELDYRKSYEELRPQFTKTTQELSRLKRDYGMTTKELQSLKQAQQQFAEQLAKATEKPINPEEFLRDLQTQGPKALDSYLKKQLDTIRSEHAKSYEEVVTKNAVLEANVEVLKRERDSKNYPNFADLKDAMQELADSGKVPDEIYQKSTGEVYDYLYNQVKAQHSEEALKKAEEFGKKKAEAAIAKESATTVAGGGNGDVNIANPSKMSAAELRKHFIAQGMVSDE